MSKLDALLDDPDFQELYRQKKSISLVLSVITIVVYFGFILLLAFSPSTLSTL